LSYDGKSTNLSKCKETRWGAKNNANEEERQASKQRRVQGTTPQLDGFTTMT